MAKYVAKERLRHAVSVLKEFRGSVPHQGIQHLLPLLALRQRGVNTNSDKHYEEQDDFAFWDKYFLVDSSSQSGRYYDPFSGERRISTHPHSNVATARKGTFAASWHAASYDVEDGETSWRLAEDYLQRVVLKILTKAGDEHRVPLLDLIAWLRRGDVLPDDASTAALVNEFKDDFGLTDEEMARLFEVTQESGAAFFAEAATAAADVLEIIGDAPSSVMTLVSGTESASFVESAKAAVSGLALPEGILVQAITALSIGSHLLLAGPPGTGKSTLAERLAAASTQANFTSGYKTTTATADWTTFDTIGGYIPTGNGSELAFQEGVVLAAIRADNWCIIDELNRANIDKAIGALITLLAGSEETAIVELPYRHVVGDGDNARREPVRIRRDVGREKSGRDGDSGDYVIGRNWRLIATMNTFDRNNLFPLTAAFARRFATVYVGIPPAADALDALGIHSTVMRAVFTVIMAEVDADLTNPRPLGPAIARDTWKYVERRMESAGAENAAVAEHEGVLEGLVLYVLPQYSGLEPLDWTPLRDRIIEALTSSMSAADKTTGSARALRMLDGAFRGLQGA